MCALKVPMGAPAHMDENSAPNSSPFGFDLEFYGITLPSHHQSKNEVIAPRPSGASPNYTFSLASLPRIRERTAGGKMCTAYVVHECMVLQINADAVHVRG